MRGYHLRALLYRPSSALSPSFWIFVGGLWLSTSFRRWFWCGLPPCCIRALRKPMMGLVRQRLTTSSATSRLSPPRSEERRVGKEGGSGGSTENEKERRHVTWIVTNDM